MTNRPPDQPDDLDEPDDPGEAAAEAAGLHYETDAQPGINRRRQGRGFSYRDPRGRTVGGRERERISALAIPPAWTAVWISANPKGHLQATGRDAKGRKQYRYHDTWRAVRDADKFERLAEFGAALPELRRKVDSDLGSGPLSRDQVLALVVRLLDETLIRVGNEEYVVENESYGLTTLRDDHVTVGTGSFILRFVGKGGIEHDVTVHDRRLARLVRRCHELGGHELFTYRAADGSIGTISSTDVNDYLHHQVGPEVTAKVFRTWGASARVTEALGPQHLADDETEVDRAVIAAIDDAAALLGNTRSVCRQSYIHPAVPDSYRSGALGEAWAGSRGSTFMHRSDRALSRLLDTSSS
jgi:DNA topoisomerase-1